MAILVSKSMPLNLVRVICAHDDALDPASDLDEYKKTLDQSKLSFVDGKQATVFVCNFKLDAKQAKLIKNSMMQTGEDGSPSITLGSWAMTVAKLCLKDIQNPEYLTPEERLVFKKDGNGYVSDSLLADLEEYGVVAEIFSYFTVLTNKNVKAADSKN
jgi:hypothetical protein